MNQEVILTISIMISKKKDTIKKCLDSIMPLLQSVPSELILVDTGCDRDTLELISKYTDNIVKFKWCNDFAQARNAGRKMAKGKWFLYLDDDEWFEDVSEFIQFFKSGEYLKYGYCMYYQRNYSNISGTLFEDAIVYRMIRLESDIQFIYPIHECFNRIPGEVKQFKAYVHHYGYVYKTEAEKYAHAWRNIKPLKQEIKKEPNNLKHVLQLSQEYNVIGEYEKSIEESVKGIEEWRNGRALHDFCVNSLYANVIDLYKQQYRYEELYSTGKEYLKLGQLDGLTRCLIQGKMAWACFSLKKYEECISYAKNYLSGYQENLRTPGIFLSEFTTVMNINCFDRINLGSVISCGIQAAVKCRVVKLAQEWFQNLSWDDKILITDSEMIRAIVRAAALVQEEEAGAYLKMCEVMLSRVELETLIIDMIQEIYEEAKLEINLKWQRFVALKCEHWYFIWLKICENKEETEEEKKLLYQRLWINVEDVMRHSVQYGIWNKMFADRMDIGGLLKEIPLYRWENAIASLCTQVNVEAVENIHRKIIIVFCEKDMHRKLWQIYYLQRSVFYTDELENIPIEDPLIRLYDLMETNLLYYKEIYSELVFKQIIDILPISCQIALKIQLIRQDMEVKNYKPIFSAMKDIVQLDFHYSSYIKICLDWVGKQIDKDDSDKRIQRNEFAKLAISVKNKVRELIEQNQFAAASEIITQLENMLPDDIEINMLRDQINRFIR